MNTWIEPAWFTEPDTDACDNCTDHECDECGTGCCGTDHDQLEES